MLITDSIEHLRSMLTHDEDGELRCSVSGRALYVTGWHRGHRQVHRQDKQLPVVDSGGHRRSEVVLRVEHFERLTPLQPQTRDVNYDCRAKVPIVNGNISTSDLILVRPHEDVHAGGTQCRVPNVFRILIVKGDHAVIENTVTLKSETSLRAVSGGGVGMNSICGIVKTRCYRPHT
jgi:hypothetical protein